MARKPAPQAARKIAPIVPDLMLERACPAPVCGVDEAGRGPWAGPDSKKLTAKAREALEVEIKDSALAWGVGFASVADIAELNILHATGLAMCRAIEALAIAPVFALVDGNYPFKLPCDVKTVVGGDGKSLSIAAASILAKVARDRLMVEMDGLYPGYGFAGHKGYGAPAHIDALERLGPCEIHRHAWSPVQKVLRGESIRLEIQVEVRD